MSRKEDDRFYETYLQFAIDGYTELNMSALPSVKVVYLTINEQNTVSFPNDMMDYVLIGLNSGGRIHTLTRNRNLVIPVNQTCGEWVRDNLTTDSNENGQVDGYMFSDHDYDGEHISGRYAMGGGFNSAYYRVDYTNRQIIFLTNEGMSGMTIILEYTSSGINSNSLVPREAIQALLAFVHMSIDEHDKNVSDNLKERNLRKWRDQRDLLYARRHSFTLSEFLDEKYLNLSQGVKR